MPVNALFIVFPEKLSLSMSMCDRQKTTEKHKKDMLEERDQKTKLFIKLKELQAGDLCLKLDKLETIAKFWRSNYYI